MLTYWFYPGQNSATKSRHVGPLQEQCQQLYDANKVDLKSTFLLIVYRVIIHELII